MTVIPSSLRAEAAAWMTPSGSVLLRDIYAASGRATVGIAFAGETADTVRLAGLAVASLPAGSCAVAATRLEWRDGRLWGVLCRGQGPVAVASPEMVKAGPLYVTSRAAGLEDWQLLLGPVAFVYGRRSSPHNINPARVRNAGEVPGIAVLTWTVTSEAIANMPLGTYTITQELAPGQEWSIIGALDAWLQTNNHSILAVHLTGTISLSLRVPAQPARPRWQSAVERLAWHESGMSWWERAEQAARAGLWVRRDSWADTTRRIRLEAGAGTARAVGVTATTTTAPMQADGLTAPDFLADDWLLWDAVAPAPIDLHDAVLWGPAGAVIFVSGPLLTDPPVEEEEDNSEEPPPLTGMFVRMAIEGKTMWVPGKEFNMEEFL